jgi:hypothetical protein
MGTLSRGSSETMHRIILVLAARCLSHACRVGSVRSCVHIHSGKVVTSSGDGADPDHVASPFGIDSVGAFIKDQTGVGWRSLCSIRRSERAMLAVFSASIASSANTTQLKKV